MPALQGFYDAHKNDVNMCLIECGGESQEEVEEFLKENNYNMPIGLDEDVSIARKYGISTIPHGVILDKDHKIIAEVPLRVTKDDLEKLIK